MSICTQCSLQKITGELLDYDQESPYEKISPSDFNHHASKGLTAAYQLTGRRRVTSSLYSAPCSGTVDSPLRTPTTEIGRDHMTRREYNWAVCHVGRPTTKAMRAPSSSTTRQRRNNAAAPAVHYACRSGHRPTQRVRRHVCMTHRRRARCEITRQPPAACHDAASGVHGPLEAVRLRPAWNFARAQPARSAIPDGCPNQDASSRSAHDNPCGAVHFITLAAPPTPARACEVSLGLGGSCRPPRRC